ncbi:MAG: hypothetical protein KAI24_01840 [Planctomycetes bacterium]|nr:hypothetical protein [Planctomycetota bacterium]
MQDTIDQARKCSRRIRAESELAKLEYECSVLRTRWHAAMARRGGPDSATRTANLRRWAAFIDVLEDRIHRLRAGDDEVST